VWVAHEFESAIAQTLSVVAFFSAAGIPHSWEKEKKKRRRKKRIQ
jgi:hypothetical protein